MKRPLQIAIDGPAAGGKTTVARSVAARLQMLYLDTGAMYRALAYLALLTGTEADNASALRRLCDEDGIRVVLKDGTASLGFHIFARDVELDERALHSREITAIVSTIAAHPEVREAMVLRQRAIADDVGVVMAGRDIGTIVLPEAAVKIFLTASIEARARRRQAQLAESGIESSVDRLTKEIEERDRLDRGRAVAPLVPASDARVVDSSDLSVEQVVQTIVDIAKEAVT